MTGSLSYPAPPPIQPVDEERRSIWRVLVDLFEKNPLANALFMLAIVIGFFHGWLKVHVRSPITTFAFDIPIVISMAVTILTRQRDDLFPRSPVGDALKFHTLICILYIPASIFIWDVPPLAVMASFRGWCIIPLIFLIGYHLATSIRQVEFYMWMVITLGVVTAVYGIFQSEEEVRKMMAMDPEFEFRFRNQFYSSNGSAQFRRFSTFVSSASFAGQLAYSTSFAFSRLSVRTCPLLERLILGTMAGVMAYAMMLTGARSGLLTLALAVVFALWYRRGGVLLIFLPLTLLLAWKFGLKATDGVAASRYASVLESDTIWLRFWIVLGPSWDAFLEAPLGTGLASSSHGVPMILLSALKRVRPIDGDLGHLVVDLGIIGVFSIANIFYHGIRNSWKWMSTLRDTPISVISLPAGIFFMQAVVTFPIGTPFLGIPYGALMWFFFGALSRLFKDYERFLASGAVDTVTFREKFTSFIAAPKMRSLYRDDEAGAAAGAVAGAPRPVPVAVAVRPMRRVGDPAVGPIPPMRTRPGAKRFLYYKPPSKNS
jgi:hypothetical protein